MEKSLKKNIRTHTHIYRYAVATRSRKQTQKDNEDSGAQFITLAGPRQTLLLGKDPSQFLWKPYIPLSVCVQTHLPKFPDNQS